MYQLSAVMAWCYNWCLTRAERMPRWQGYVIEILAALGLIAVAILAPNWVLFTYWVIVCSPVSVFGAAHHSVWKKRDEIWRDQQNQLQKTKSLIGRSK
ncbi:hypothetical protein [Ruegeria sp. AU67]|uniref:hypothetical protein n=1 Tax=Ruegeria sp. AU67 TaxID=2108530 RepID=UPI000D69EDAF|nr:hypothetical protein [Ruegeria sp. AU67]